ncbi:25218_t:CDS:2 [Cetraspora pellucida]|uniref:25218_t:CDS:1 n=1 Tax=Cetraspora pellucida TaxID=1433469 RepID=A0A9N8W7C4_9GLOM|nr:25218_t:CDS:2 [Cetraspora pellucida]
MQGEKLLIKKRGIGCLIPMGNIGKDRLIVGHNVGFDRARIREYHHDRSCNSYIDTMSLHVTVSGLCTQHRTSWIKYNKAIKESKDFQSIHDASSINNLRNIYRFYCQGELDKCLRNYFINSSLDQIVKPEVFQKLVAYRADGVFTTHKVLKKLFPRFLKIYPHPISFAGIISMNNKFMTTPKDWDYYIEKIKLIRQEESKPIEKSLQRPAFITLKSYSDDSQSIINNPWLRQLDWSTPPRVKKLKGYQQWYRNIYNTKTRSLKSISRPRTSSISLRLKWQGFPLYYFKKHRRIYRRPKSNEKYQAKAKPFRFDEMDDNKEASVIGQSRNYPSRLSKYLELSEKGSLHLLTENDFNVILHCLFAPYWKPKNVLYWLNRIYNDIRENGLRLNKYTYETILNLYVIIGNVSKAESIFSEIVKEIGIPTRKTYNILLHMYARVGNIQRCLELVQEMKMNLIMPNLTTYNTHILSYVRNLNITGAHFILQEMEQQGVKPDVITFNVMINGFLNFHDFKGAEQCFDIMLGMGIAPNIITFNTIMSGYLDVGDFQSVEDIYDKMLELKIQPGLDTYHILATAFVRMGKTEQVLLIIDQIIANGWHVLRTYNILINMYVKMNDLGMAYKVYDRLLSSGLQPNVVTFNTFITGHINQRNLDEALKCYDKMLKRGISPNMNVFNNLLRGYLHAYGMTSSRKIFEQMAKHHLVPDQVTYNILIQYIYEQDDVEIFEKAIEQYVEMLGNGLHPSNRTFNILLNLAIKKDINHNRFYSHQHHKKSDPIQNCDKSAVELVLKDMMSKYVVLDVVTYSILMKGFVHYQHMQGAEELFRKMQENGIRPNQYIFDIMIDGYAKIPDMNKAQRAITRMLNSGFQKNIKVYNSMINGYAAAGDIGAAHKEFDEMKKAGHTPDKVSYTSLVDMFANNKDVKHAQQAFDFMRAQGIQVDLISFTALMKAYAKVGNVKGAYSVFEAMVNAGYKPDSVATLTLLSAL